MLLRSNSTYIILLFCFLAAKKVASICHHMPSYAIICHTWMKEGPPSACLKDCCPQSLSQKWPLFGNSLWGFDVSLRVTSRTTCWKWDFKWARLEPNSASRSSGVDAHVFSRRWLVCDQCHSAVHRHAREHRASQARICFKGSNKQLELAKKQFADVQLTHFQIDVC